jgi:nucleotide-binding universal stress UspA family protein
MTVIVWVVESAWRACVDAARRHAPADDDVVLLHITDADVAEVAHGAFAGLLGRGHPRRDPGIRMEDLATAAAHQLLDDAAARLSRPCRKVERAGRVESEVLAAADGAELLVLARDGDPSHLGPRSIGHASRFVIDHAACPVLLVWPGSPPPGLPPPGLPPPGSPPAGSPPAAGHPGPPPPPHPGPPR